MPPRFARIRHLQIILKYLTLNQKKAAQPVGHVAFRGVCIHQKLGWSTNSKSI